MSSRWGQYVSERAGGQPRVDAGDVVRNASKSYGKVAFSGKDEVRSGQHVARFRIVKSSYNNGADIFIGVVDASVAAQAGDCSKGGRGRVRGREGEGRCVLDQSLQTQCVHVHRPRVV